MDFQHSERSLEYQGKLTEFMDECVYPAESVYEQQMRESDDPHHFPEACNCNASDTGNMEVFELYGTDEHREKYLEPLLRGDIRSAFAMTEPGVASSDATNVRMSMERTDGGYVLNGRKWFTSNGMHPHLKVMIVMGKTSPDAEIHRQQSMLAVPADAPRRDHRAEPAGVRLPRPRAAGAGLLARPGSVEGGDHRRGRGPPSDEQPLQPGDFRSSDPGDGGVDRQPGGYHRPRVRFLVHHQGLVIAGQQPASVLAEHERVDLLDVDQYRHLRRVMPHLLGVLHRCIPHRPFVE